MNTKFIDLLEEEVPTLRRFALHLSSDRHSAEDLVNDCVERAIRKQDMWKPGTNLRAWLFRMMRNLFISKKRRLKTSRNYIEIAQHQTARSTPGNQADRMKMRDVGRSMRKLPTEQRQIVLLSAIRGLSYQEISESLEIPVGTVRSRLSRARSTLREESGVSY